MSHDTWLHRLVRYAVRPLTRTAVTPNHLTAVRLLTGLGAVACFAAGARGPEIWGALLFLVSMLFDRADGELARLSGRSSRAGHVFDLVSDALVNSLAFVGIGAGLHGGSFGAWALPMGLVAGVAVAAILWLMLRVEAVAGEMEAPFPAAAGFDADDAVIVVPLAMLAGWSEPLLAAAALGAPVFALYAAWRHRHALFRRAET